MARYVAMEPPTAEPDRDAILVRDGFHVAAFLFPVFWFLFHRMWWEALAAVAGLVILAALARLPGFDGMAFWTSLLVGLYVGLEGAELRIAALRRRGWRDGSVFEAASRGDAEARYAEDLIAQPEKAPVEVPDAAPRRPMPWTRAPRSEERTALGLFGYPGR